MVKEMAENPIILHLQIQIQKSYLNMRNTKFAQMWLWQLVTGLSKPSKQCTCFPYIFRGALDVGATTINEDMKIACVHAIARMAHIEADAATYGEKSASFGRDYLIPPTGSAPDSGNSHQQWQKQQWILVLRHVQLKISLHIVKDFLSSVYNSAFLMKPIFSQAKLILSVLHMPRVKINVYYVRFKLL